MDQPQQSDQAVPQLPNPGSVEALAQGCLCPVIDNGHGKQPPYPPDGWWMTIGCPVHAPNPVEEVA